MKYLTAVFFSIVFFINSYSQEFVRPFYFNEGSSELKGYYNDVLADLANEIKSGGYTIRVEGHTNDYGTAYANMRLSEKRSSSVVDVLKKNGISENDMKITNFGETLPTYNNSWPLGRKLNRRVDLVIEGMSEFGNSKKKKTISDLYEDISPKPEKFCYTFSDTAYVTKNKTVIYFPKEAFNVAGYREGSCIDIYVEEFLTKKEMMIRGLSTTSNGLPMKSAGMMNVYAKYNGNLLDLNDNKSYTVVRKDIEDFDEELGVFEGNWNEEHINWEMPGGGEIPGNIQIFSGGLFNDRGVFNADELDRPCKFFFCKIGRFFRSKKKNAEIDSFMAAVADSVSLMNRIGGDRRDLLEKYEVDDYKDLKAAMEKAYENGEGAEMTVEDMEFYIYKLNSPGWSNLDWMMKIPKDQFRELTIDLKPNDKTDCKLMFDDYNTILPGIDQKDNYSIKNVPDGYTAKLVVIRMVEDKTKLAIVDISNQKKISNLDFKTFTIKELQEKLKNL